MAPVPRFELWAERGGDEPGGVDNGDGAFGEEAEEAEEGSLEGNVEDRP